MGNMFQNDSRQFKFDILVEICREVKEGNLKESNVQKYARQLVSVSGPRFRCCVYKEREVLRQRVRLAMGEMANDIQEHNPRQIIQVIDAACDGCTIHKIRVTDNCRKCMAKSCMGSCRFGAMRMGAHRAEIDYDKCKECQACVNACTYNAIVVTERPCYNACPVQAISWDENRIAQIDENICINCGQCEAACPFGAIEDISWVVPVQTLLKMETPAYAIVAPSIQGQFDNTSLPQILKAIEMLGFKKCYEVAIGADAVAEYEYRELKEHHEQGKPMTTSCCPGFVNMLKIHFPELYEANKSTTVTPMMALARKLKKEHPEAGVVFIGPCLAKKQEAMIEVSAVDYVMTYEELAAMLIANEINPEDVVADADVAPSNYGRNFAVTSGVASAVAQAAKEHGDGPYTTVLANGAKECKKQLTLLKHNRFTADILEGMCCPGGCIGGPACISDPLVVKGRMIKENLPNKAKTITESLDHFDFDEVNMDVNSKF